MYFYFPSSLFGSGDLPLQRLAIGNAGLLVGSPFDGDVLAS